MSSGDYIDIGVLLVVLILGLRGLSNGLVHEIMGVVGFVLGIYLATCYCVEGAEYLRLAGLDLENKSVLLLLAFLLIVFAVWVGFLVLGVTLGRFVVSVQEIATVNVYGGFVFAVLKYFVVLSVLVYGCAQIEFLKKPLEGFVHETRSYPIMYGIAQKIVGAEMIKNLEKIYKDVETTPQTSTQHLESTAEHLKSAGGDIVKATHKELDDGAKIVEDKITAIKKSLDENKSKE